MLKRRLQPVIEGRLRSSPAVVLLGPRQVGKTTIARQLARARGRTAVYLDLERPSDLRRLDDADAFLRAQAGSLVVLDEIHRLPGLFAVLRGVIDQQRTEGGRVTRFLLLGSASLDLMRQASETLAGRVSYMELPAIDAGELPRGRSTDTLWTRGGFPLSLLAPDDSHSLEWRRDFIRSYLERDVPMFAPRMPTETIARLWTMLAHAQGTLLNQSRLASGLGVSAPAVGRYVDLLSDLLLVRRLRPWSNNLGKRLVRTPKTYIRDSGLLHGLLELETMHDLLGHPAVGASWEGFVIENLLAVSKEGAVPYFYRTEDGSEIDLVIEHGGRVEVAVEIKRSTAPEVSKGFRLACAVLRPKAAFIVHSGIEEWPMKDGVVAISLAGLMRRLRRAR